MISASNVPFSALTNGLHFCLQPIDHIGIYVSLHNPTTLLLVVSNHRGGGISAQAAAWLTLAKNLAGPADGSGGPETAATFGYQA